MLFPATVDSVISTPDMTKLYIGETLRELERWDWASVIGDGAEALESDMIAENKQVPVERWVEGVTEVLSN